jgi:hypothetical protein
LQVSQKLRFGVPIESHANEIYTRAMYEIFCDEMYAAGGFAISKVCGEGVFVVVETNHDRNKDAKEFTVSFKLSVKITCQCGLFEHLGMICRHSLKVMFDPFQFIFLNQTHI